MSKTSQKPPKPEEIEHLLKKPTFTTLINTVLSEDSTKGKCSHPHLTSVLVQKLAQDSTISFDLSPADAIRKAEMLTNIIRSEEMNSKSKIKSKITTEEHDLNSAKDNAIASKASQLKDKPRKLSKESDDIIPSEDDDNLDDEFSKDLLDDKKNLCNKLPKKATQILKDWFLNNIHNPYPSPEVKDALTKKTGLSRKQLQNWFTNVRKV
eukprot:TRINITY_DN2983_c0_g1_i1.p1 TRINITY_DN2983_c0_g1~~TRINITY_DN2983_c0_g1_i1.p1  ORF type:complete len:209 (+),score=35.69 TRINITY_DN2983_c0_g1_i1:155-781(+)